jgi:hypothetical protein
VGASRVWDAGLAARPKDAQEVGTDLPCQGRRSCAVGFFGAYRPASKGKVGGSRLFPLEKPLHAFCCTQGFLAEPMKALSRSRPNGGVVPRRIALSAALL